MLTRDEITALIMIRNRPGGIINPKGRVYQLPMDILHRIANVGLDENNLELAKLLQHIADGDLKSAQELLDENPTLIGKASHVKTPSGQMIKFVKPFELALCCGDPEMAAMIAVYFDGFTDGAEEKAAQSLKYAEDIEKIFAHQPFNFTTVLDAIKKATPEDVAAELDSVANYTSALRSSLQAFKQQFSALARKPGQLQIRYADIIELLKQLNDNSNSFDDVSEHNAAKQELALRHLYGFVVRFLPAVDRMYFAQGLHWLDELKESFKRSYELGNADLHFPEVNDKNASSGLGYDYYISGHWGSKERLDPAEELASVKAHVANKQARLSAIIEDSLNQNKNTTSIRSTR